VSDVDRLAGKVAIITGGAQGQGEGAARAFVAEGAKVVIADIADEPGKALAQELGENAHYVHLDVSDEESWRAAVDEAVATYGPVNVLVNNAGVLLFAELTKTTTADFERLFRVNQLGCFLGMRTVAPIMVENGGGSIVNSSSIEGLGGMPTLVAYTATKFAIRGMTKAAAMELGPKGVRVNSVHPGMIDTGMIRGYTGDEGMHWGGRKVALKRVGTPADIAHLYVFLASDESCYSTGAEFVADGGATATHAFGG
jgi:3alpha(or 20beta)-hydroxysteroid dehydrogenase